MASLVLVVVACTQELMHQSISGTHACCCLHSGTHGNHLGGFLGGALVILVVFLGGALVFLFLVLVVSFRAGFGVVGWLSGSIMPGFGRRVVSPLGLTGGRTTDGTSEIWGVATSRERPALVVAPQGAIYSHMGIVQRQRSYAWGIMQEQLSSTCSNRMMLFRQLSTACPCQHTSRLVHVAQRQPSRMSLLVVQLYVQLVFLLAMHGTARGWCLPVVCGSVCPGAFWTLAGLCLSTVLSAGSTLSISMVPTCARTVVAKCRIKTPAPWDHAAT